MKRYAIWDKESPIITPIGEVLSAGEWITRYPIAAMDSITVVCAAGEINGGFFGTLGQMILTAENEGCDFSNCETAEEKLAKIEAFEDERDAKAKSIAEAKVAEDALASESLASIASSLEFQNMLALDDVEEV